MVLFLLFSLKIELTKFKLRDIQKIYIFYKCLQIKISFIFFIDSVL